ncbi:hypothetical protein KIKIMORA_00400 [Brevundimonas phage vB_BpoS-Kikimora]|uniref:Uncharacterized protein n=2 Tax=Kikimoravirus TaxID=3425051 RepID=A0A9E7N1C4_9CAUD|nr:hypothetical protein KIKIMORA_00400 [Brevundimonas phage vB_BpoS-Kikimora]UTC28076.1 hypothetical protein GURKE_00440 [Brevundimonas phage vB_BpoS-Gurke]
MSELPLNKAAAWFVGKTIEAIDASACNQVEFRFTDGTKVALHIEVGAFNLPYVMACDHCTTSV